MTTPTVLLGIAVLLLAVGGFITSLQIGMIMKALESQSKLNKLIGQNSELQQTINEAQSQINGGQIQLNLRALKLLAAICEKEGFNVQDRAPIHNTEKVD
jgi:uncharacterized membrane protein (DUF106 family)